MHQPKIATCNYCGRRTMLTPTALQGHELACGACGAPLHLMKPLPVAAARAAASHTPSANPKKLPRKKDRKRKKPKWKKLLSEVWDELEDVFD